MMNYIDIRIAKREDVPHIIRLLVNDQLGNQRESYQDPLPQQYYDAFNEIDKDKNNYLIVVVNGEQIIGTLQLTFIPYLTYQGRKRGQIEAVRIDELYRGKGIGKRMIEWVIAKEKNCSKAQLALAWILMHNKNIVPIPGTKKIQYLEENLSALDIQLSQEDINKLNNIFPVNVAKGEKYPEEFESEA